MVPQAAGAGNSVQVSNMLVMATVWCCVILLIPVATFFFFIGDIVPLPGDGGADGYGGYGYGYATPVDCLTMNLTTSLNTTTGMLDPEPQLAAGNGTARGGVAGEEENCDLQCELTRFCRASMGWLLPYIFMSTAQTWLECLEIVGAVALNATFWAAAKVPLAYFLMVDEHAAMGLVGFAHAYTIATCCELGTMWLVVVVWKKQHVEPTQWWHGVRCRPALSVALSKRFVKLAAPMVVQMAADFAGSTIFYSLMSTVSTAHVAAFGVADALRGTGGSISMGLYTASSIRVGTLLGEGDPAGAKRAALAGVIYNVLLGSVLCVLLIVFRDGIAAFMVPNEADRAVKEMTSEAMVPLAVLVLLTALQWGLWSALEGQARACLTSVILSIGTWVIAVPSSVLALALWCVASTY
jgi:Na+-driven multidrug efflux pump